MPLPKQLHTILLKYLINFNEDLHQAVGQGCRVFLKPGSQHILKPNIIGVGALQEKGRKQRPKKERKIFPGVRSKMEPNNDVHPPDLCCPISLELLEDPVTTPCCGRTFSRAPLSQYLAGNTACPLCRARIKKKFPHWDVGEVPPNRFVISSLWFWFLQVRHRNIIAMIEHYQLSKKASAEGKSVPRLVLDDDPVWNCVIRPVNDSLGEELPGKFFCAFRFLMFVSVWSFAKRQLAHIRRRRLYVYPSYRQERFYER